LHYKLTRILITGIEG